jgi:hypothetical protein
MVAEGWSHADIALHVEKTTGHQVKRSAVSAALSRAGLTKATPRYKAEIPWRVSEAHLTEYPVRMLRLLGRKRRGLPMNEEEDDRLASWMDQLSEWNAVVAYSPTMGFLYVAADEIGDWEDGIPIRRRTITDDEVAK